jgi:hypothetical protein
VASVMDQYGIVINTDPVTGAQTIAQWVVPKTSLYLVWDNGMGGAADQTITSQAQAIQVLNQAAANKTPLRLISASLIQPMNTGISFPQNPAVSFPVAPPAPGGMPNAG